MNGQTFVAYVVRSLLQDAGLVVAVLAAGCITCLAAVVLSRAKIKADNRQEARRPLRLLTAATLLVCLGTVLVGALSLDGSARFLAKPIVQRSTSAPSTPGENSTPSVNPCWPRADAVVVLSGGTESTSMPSFNTLLRIETAAAMVSAEARSGKPYSLIVLSGGVGDPELGVSEAAVMKLSFLRFLASPEVLEQSAPPTEIALEQLSLTTLENALYTRKIFSERQQEPRTDLVTSAEHMWRARLAFEAQGFRVCPRPAMPRRFRSMRLFSFRQASFSIEILHEWLGLAGYAVSENLFPRFKN